MSNASEKYNHTIRKARKAHRCEHRSRPGRDWTNPDCPGVIEAGSQYVECYELGEPFHPARYHQACWDFEMTGGASCPTV
jgi:hypothetical protein